MNADSTPLAPRSRLRSWLPGVLIAVGGGFALLALARVWESFGYVLVLGVPLAIGFALGYGLDLKRRWIPLVATVVLLGLVGGGIWAGLAGLVCGLIFTVIALLPVLGGAALGHSLRLRHRRRRTEYVKHGASAVLLLVMAGLLYAESLLPVSASPEVVTTSRVLALQTGGAWERLVFYEEIPRRPPLLARIGLPQALRTEGRAQGVGDVKRCLYSTGYLKKRITGYDPQRLLAFDVIEQVGIEERSVELVSGRFDFEPLAGGRTRVTLTTTYRPLLAARPFWRPFEHAVAHVLHRHVLDGMVRQDGPRKTWVLAHAPEP